MQLKKERKREKKEKASPGGCNWREEQVWGKQGKKVLEEEKVDGKGKGKESMGKNKVREKVFLTKAYRLRNYYYFLLVTLLLQKINYN